jgi:hypothetical protein
MRGGGTIGQELFGSTHKFNLRPRRGRSDSRKVALLVPRPSEVKDSEARSLVCRRTAGNRLYGRVLPGAGDPAFHPRLAPWEPSDRYRQRLLGNVTSRLSSGWPRPTASLGSSIGFGGGRRGLGAEPT